MADSNKKDVLITLLKSRAHNFNKVEISIENIPEKDVSKYSNKIDEYLDLEHEKLKKIAPAVQPGQSNRPYVKKELTGPATQAQLNFLKKVGVVTKANVSKQEASDLIDAHKNKGNTASTTQKVTDG